jgi:serine/threonine-protein phosphatase 2B regulatory subunit
MGGSAASPFEDSNELTPDQFNKYKTNTGFTDREIVSLVAKYKELVGSRDLGGTGSIEEDDFLVKMNCPNRAVGHLMYKMIDEDGSGSIELSEFIYGLALFRPNAPFEAKVEACFNAYDEDGGKTVSQDEVFNVIWASLEDNPLCVLDSDIVEELTNSLMAEAGKDPDGTLTLPEFTALVNKFKFLLDCFEFDVESIMG